MNNKVFRRDPDFRFGILKRYGTKCAVCSISIEDIIETAHIVKKKTKGLTILGTEFPYV